MRLRLLCGAATAALLLTLAPAAVVADAPTMLPLTGPPTGGTVVVISGGSGFTDDTTVTVGIKTVHGFASTGGTTFTFATPAQDPNLSNPAPVTTSNPAVAGLPAFSYVSTIVPGAQGLTGTVRTADGSPIHAADVWIIRSYPEGILARTTTDANGHYDLAAPAGDYYGAFAQARDGVVHEVGFWSMAVAAGGTTLLDWVLPEMSMTGGCEETSCTVDVSLEGFGALEPVEIYLGSNSIIVDGHSWQLDLGTLTTSASGAASGDFSFPKLASGPYYAAAGPRDPVSYGRTTYSHETLLVTAPSAPIGRTWAATISGAGLAGRTSLTIPATGRATAAFWLYRLTSGVSVSARIASGTTCDAAATTIIRMPGYVTTIGGTWRQRWIFDGSGLARLRSALRSGTRLWFQVSAGGRRTCVRLLPAR